MPLQNLWKQPFEVIWKTALVRAPRAVPTQVLRFTNPDGPYPFIVKLKSRGSHTIPCYVFIPIDIYPDDAASLPVVVDFHGGGFFLGSCLEQAPFCARMARGLRAVVLSVDYRMGPVDKFPAANEDAEDVLAAILDDKSKAYQQLRDSITTKIFENWRDAKTKTERDESTEEEQRVTMTEGPLADSLRKRSAEIRKAPVDLAKHRIAISGFSSGGNLALNLGLSVTHPDAESRWPSVFPSDHPAPIPLLLFYPSLDARQLPSERTRPPDLPESSKFWEGVDNLLVPTYLPREQAAHPRASPGLVDLREGLHSMARVMLVLPELDTLAEQSEQWVREVQKADRGRHLRVERYKGMKHGWTQMPESWLKEGRKAFQGGRV